MGRAARIVPPRWARANGKARDGSPLLLLRGCEYTHDIPVTDYVLSCAHHMDKIFGASDLQMCTVLVDVREHVGCANVPATKMLPLFRGFNSVLATHYPERAHRFVIYPLPLIVTRFWNTLAGVLMDPVTREKIMFLPGPSSVGSPCPRELGNYVSIDQL